jgi:putative ABC transport system ATP-binding protein
VQPFAAAGDTIAGCPTPPHSPPRHPADAPAGLDGVYGRPVVELIGVEKTYYKPDGSVMVQALRGVDLTIREGEYVAIMGASGSGKSTLMNTLGCLDKPTKGRYILDGKDARGMDDESLSKFRGEKIGFVFQAFNLIPQLTVEENVEVPLFYQGKPAKERKARSEESLGLVGLDDRMDHRPRELSGGQQQRVAIARALVTRPVILMADEPTGNLDSKTGAQILALFEDLHDKGMTIIMVTHDDDIAEHCERIVRLRDGVVEYDRLTDRGAPAPRRAGLRSRRSGPSPHEHGGPSGPPRPALPSRDPLATSGPQYPHPPAKASMNAVMSARSSTPAGSARSADGSPDRNAPVKAVMSARSSTPNGAARSASQSTSRIRNSSAPLRT